MDEKKKWKLLGSKPIFESKWLSIEDRTYELPNGSLGEGYIHLNRRDYVLVVACDDVKQIVVEKQYRRGVDDFVYELPAGWIEKGENPIDAAKRELREETGFLAEGNFTIEIYPQPGYSSMKAYVVVLQITQKGNHDREQDEFIEHELLKIEKVKQMISEGKIKDMGFLSAFSVFENLRK